MIETAVDQDWGSEELIRILREKVKELEADDSFEVGYKEGFDDACRNMDEEKDDAYEHGYAVGYEDAVKDLKGLEEEAYQNGYADGEESMRDW